MEGEFLLIRQEMKDIPKIGDKTMTTSFEFVSNGFIKVTPPHNILTKNVKYFYKYSGKWLSISNFVSCWFVKHKNLSIE